MHFNGLTAPEHERLSLLMEECGEVVQIIGKIMRHGYKSHNPDDPKRTSNKKLLEKEIGHVMYSVSLLSAGGDIDLEACDVSKLKKGTTVKKYLHHNFNLL